MAKRQSQALAIVHRNIILARIAAGDYLDLIAQDIGITDAAISRQLAGDPEYIQAREYGVARRLMLSKRAVDQIADMGVDENGAIVGLAHELVNLARVREVRLKADQWFAEREFPERWGQHNQVTVNQGTDLGDRLRRAKERTVTGERIDVGATMGATPQLPSDNSDDNQ